MGKQRWPQSKGGTIRDVVLVKSAHKTTPDRIYSLNLKHFVAMAPADLRAKICRVSAVR